MLDTTLSSLLDTALPDAQIAADLRNYLAETEQNGNFVLDFSGRTVLVPVESPITVIYKGFTQDNFCIRYSAYNAYVAFGAVKKTVSNVLLSEYCFARVYYDAACHFISADVDEDYLSRS